jgi:hypothetical protein
VNVRVVLGKLQCNTVYKVKFSTSTQHSHLLSTHADAIVTFKVLEGYSGHGLNTGLYATFLDENQLFKFLKFLKGAQA